MNTSIDTVQARNVAPGYLKTSDPVFISIKDRAVTDLKQSVERSDPKSPENKLFLTTMEAWPQEKKDQFHALVGKSIENYISQTRLSDVGMVDVGTFFLELISKILTRFRLSLSKPATGEKSLLRQAQDDFFLGETIFETTCSVQRFW